MKYFIILAIITLYSTLNFAKNSEGYCNVNLFGDDIKITENGELKLKKDIYENFNVKKEDDTIILEPTKKLKFSHDFKYGLGFNLPVDAPKFQITTENNKVKKVTNTAAILGPNTFGQISYDFSIKNGKCYIKRIEKKNNLIADTDMCHELIDVFKQAPEQFQCNCNSGLKEKISSILKKYKASNSDVEKIENKYNITINKKEYADSIIYMNKCKDYSNINNALNDENLWNKSSENTSVKNNSNSKKGTR